MSGSDRHSSPTEAAWVEIDLPALERNVERLRRAAGARLLAVVKADAYGHGVDLVTEALEQSGVQCLCVARPQELERLRELGWTREILLLPGHVDGDVLRCALENEAQVVVSSPDQVQVVRQLGERWLNEAGLAPNRRLDLHLELDSGMHRTGLPPEQLLATAEELAALRSVRVVGLMTHLAESSHQANPRTEAQLAAWFDIRAELEAAGRLPPRLHVDNTSAALSGGIAGAPWVRAGGGLYGLDLGRNSEARDARIALEPVMAVRARIIAVSEVARGEQVGYGPGWPVERTTRIATVAIGYGDGFGSGQREGEVLIAGSRYPVVGAISMDSVTVDLGTEARVRVGDLATVLGPDGGEVLTAAELARREGAPPYEITTRFGLRLERRVAPAADRDS